MDVITSPVHEINVPVPCRGHSYRCAKSDALWDVRDTVTQDVIPLPVIRCPVPQFSPHLQNGLSGSLLQRQMSEDVNLEMERMHKDPVGRGFHI